jgi:hypothetical protein
MSDLWQVIKNNIGWIVAAAALAYLVPGLVIFLRSLLT